MSDRTESTVKVRITENGPYLVSGNLPLQDITIGANAAGDSVEWIDGVVRAHEEKYALCRCGHSGNKPFCDGTHRKVGFVGTETADRSSYAEQVTVIKGPAMTLTDVDSLCAFGRFCDPNGKVWNLVHSTDQQPAREHFVQQTCDCPSGRLVAWDNATGLPIELKYEPAVRPVADPAQDCLGPLWVRGGVQLVGADGFNYEVRNRMTLCRCGASKNKPFCDGSHASIGFNESS